MKNDCTLLGIKTLLAFISLTAGIGCGSKYQSELGTCKDSSELYWEEEQICPIAARDNSESPEKELFRGFSSDAIAEAPQKEKVPENNQTNQSSDVVDNGNSSDTDEQPVDIAQRTFSNQNIIAIGKLSLPGFYQVANASADELAGLKKTAEESIPETDPTYIPSITFDFNPTRQEGNFLQLFCLSYDLSLVSAADTLQQAFMNLSVGDLDKSILESLQLQRNSQWETVNLEQPTLLLHFASQAGSLKVSENICFRGQLRADASLTDFSNPSQVLGLSDSLEEFVVEIQVLETSPNKENPNAPACMVATNLIPPGTTLKVDWPDAAVGATVYRILQKTSEGQTQIDQFLSSDPTGLEFMIPGQFPEDLLFVDILRIPFQDELGVAYCQLQLELKMELEPEIPEESEECFTIDFDFTKDQTPLPAGLELSEQYLNFGVRLEARNNNPNRPDALITFNSAMPTGGDPDLRTPGTGQGNDTPQKNIAIIAENIVDQNGDGLVDNPDDERSGGTIAVVLEQPGLYFHSLRLIDLDESGVHAKLSSADSSIKQTNAPKLQNNSALTLNIESQLESEKLEIYFPSSGGLDDIKICNYPNAVL